MDRCKEGQSWFWCLLTVTHTACAGCTFRPDFTCAFTASNLYLNYDYCIIFNELTPLLVWSKNKTCLNEFFFSVIENAPFCLCSTLPNDPMCQLFVACILSWHCKSTMHPLIFHQLVKGLVPGLFLGGGILKIAVVLEHIQLVTFVFWESFFSAYTTKLPIYLSLDQHERDSNVYVSWQRPAHYDSLLPNVVFSSQSLLC